MTYNNILLDEDGKTATVTINRPNQLNALNKETIKELSECFGKLNEDSAIRAVILTGSGGKAFVAGADIKEFAAFGQEDGKKLAAEGQNILFDKIETMTTPVIAAVNGFALGGGLELAMSCHMRIASENAKMGLPEVSLGVIPGYGGTQRLAQLVGKGKALEMISSAGMMTAAEGEKWGLINHVVSGEELMPLAQKMAKRISFNSPNAIGAAINAVNAGYKEGVNGYEKEIEEFGKCFGTPEFIEGTTAFIEKRKAEF